MTTIGRVDFVVGLDGTALPRRAFVAGRRIGREIGRGMDVELGRAFSDFGARLERQMAVIGGRGGSALSRSFQRSLGGFDDWADDIGHLPEATQHRLLQLLDAPALGVPWAVVCASREPWRALLAPTRLHEDLFYRLNGLTLRVPSLRERSDLLELAHAIVKQEAAGRALQLDAEVIALLRVHRWPGNLRQLHNVLRAAVALTAGEQTITRAHLSEDFIDEAASDGSVQPPAGDAHAQRSLDELTLDAITQAVDAAQGNISEASRQLGISRNTIYRKLRWNRRPN